jgi:Tfp pilus assembly protein PilV
MINQLSLKKRIKGLGFIEVLIAIVVVSIVSAVFLSIAGHAMKDLIQTERIEHMARIARDGANIAQEIANQEKADVINNIEIFPKVPGECYLPLRDDSGDEVTYSFAEYESGGFKSITEDSIDDRKQILNEVTTSSYFWGEDYFLVMCIEDIDGATKWAHVRFWVGDVHVAGQITNDSDVRDFKYYAVIEL